MSAGDKEEEEEVFYKPSQVAPSKKPVALAAPKGLPAAVPVAADAGVSGAGAANDTPLK